MPGAKSKKYLNMKVAISSKESVMLFRYQTWNIQTCFGSTGFVQWAIDFFTCTRKVLKQVFIVVEVIAITGML